MKASTTRPGNKIAITWGDPSGIGPEVILKAFARLPLALKKRITLFGCPDHMATLARELKTTVKIIDADKGESGADTLAVVHSSPFPYIAAKMGKITKPSGLAAMSALEAAIPRIQAGEFAAMVTAPISKEAVNRAGYRIAGHTEFLARRCGGAPVAMMLASRKLKVVVATTHVAVKDIPRLLDQGKLGQLILLVARSVKQYGLASPRIAVCGLNPHASDGGLFGQEEARIIAPAIRAARRAGVEASGPHPADTMFTPQAREKYDVAIAMYHDQGLIPVKALSFGETVNVTLGLPFLRVSVDHGTAFDIAGKNMADERPMVHAIRTAARMLKGGF
ncbi:MAG: 4-hydroxythreonine-4-phosphate dehydrogenase PdxA [Nitrospinota bacterium]|nr:4-hydroxythreonine-4-phosphate dehydrogenase PdxA [Nitrospinota bacterium]